MIIVHCSLELLGLKDRPASASKMAGTTGVCQHAWLIFKHLFRNGSHYVAQAGVELLASSNKINHF